MSDSTRRPFLYSSTLVVTPWDVQVRQGLIRFYLWGGARGYLLVKEVGELGKFVGIPANAYVKGKIQRGYDMIVEVENQTAGFKSVPFNTRLAARFLIVDCGPEEGIRGVVELMPLAA